MTIEKLLLTNELTAAANDLESAATELEQKKPRRPNKSSLTCEQGHKASAPPSQ